MIRRRAILFALVAAAASCGRGKAPVAEVVVYTSVDQVFAEPVLRAFESQSGIAVRAVYDTEETKSTGVLNRLIAEARSPRADVFWSGDPVRPYLLIRRELVEPYRPAPADDLPAAYRDPDGRWTGLGARARVLLVNTELVAADARPRSIRDLADPRWRGKTAIANPLFGTTTMHVAALAAAWGDERTRAFLDSLRANDVKLASSNGEVKRLVAAGEVAFGLTDTDDAADAVAQGAPVAVVYPDADDLGTLVMPTTVVLLRNGPHPAPARKLIDFLVSAETERQFAATGAHMPVRGGEQPLRGMKVDYDDVGRAMERIQPWLREWVGL